MEKIWIHFLEHLIASRKPRSMGSKAVPTDCESIEESIIKKHVEEQFRHLILENPQTFQKGEAWFAVSRRNHGPYDGNDFCGGMVTKESGVTSITYGKQ